jgi:hypothetical protein
MSWKQSKNIVFLFYNPFSCGKFVGNILSYNKNFVPQFPLDGNRGNWYSMETYNAMSLDQIMSIKHDTIMKTLPTTKQDCKDWKAYELGDRGFWGFDSNMITQEYLNFATIRPKAEWLLQQEVNCFYVFHKPTLVPIIQENFPNSRIIKFINDERINQLSQDLKNNEKQVKVVDLSQIHSPGVIEFDVGSLFDKTQFFNNIDQLFKDLGMEDTSLDSNVDQYYQSYCNLYQ